MRIPVLAYHAVNIAGNDYANNDHVAFAADLRLIDDLGLRAVPVHWVVDQLLGTATRDLAGCVALTCDDGSDLDFTDVEHPTHGPQRSLYHGITDFHAERGVQAQPDLHLSCFVIASAEARGHLDRNCLAGLDWMSDRWWRPALETGRMAIENHSWDHNHAAIPLPGIAGMARGLELPRPVDEQMPVRRRHEARRQVHALGALVAAIAENRGETRSKMSHRPLERVLIDAACTPQRVALGR